MSTLYAESSAVLRWLTGAEQGDEIGRLFAKAEVIVSSALTRTEVARALRRLISDGALEPHLRDKLWARYTAAAAHWQHHAITADILQRAGETFPLDPLRTLDAIHVATAGSYALAVGLLTVVSVDRRVRDNAVALGLAVLPKAPGAAEQA